MIDRRVDSEVDRRKTRTDEWMLLNAARFPRSTEQVNSELRMDTCVYLMALPSARLADLGISERCTVQITSVQYSA